jgi:hypothetical protein
MPLTCVERTLVSAAFGLDFDPVIPTAGGASAMAQWRNLLSRERYRNRTAASFFDEISGAFSAVVKDSQFRQTKGKQNDHVSSSSAGNKW